MRVIILLLTMLSLFKTSHAMSEASEDEKTLQVLPGEVEEPTESVVRAYTIGGSGALAAGTCYEFSSCSGTSLHVFNKSLCPVTYRSFVADFINYGCEKLWHY